MLRFDLDLTEGARASNRAIPGITPRGGIHENLFVVLIGIIIVFFGAGIGSDILHAGELGQVLLVVYPIIPTDRRS